LAYIIDGTVQRDLLSWTDNHDSAVALSHNLHGQPICPVCATAEHSEPLFLVAASQRYSCARRHLFAVAGLQG
jgi:hypothetical protein